MVTNLFPTRGILKDMRRSEIPTGVTVSLLSKDDFVAKVCKVYRGVSIPNETQIGRQSERLD